MQAIGSIASDLGICSVFPFSTHYLVVVLFLFMFSCSLDLTRFNVYFFFPSGAPRCYRSVKKWCYVTQIGMLIKNYEKEEGVWCCVQSYESNCPRCVESWRCWRKSKINENGRFFQRISSKSKSTVRIKGDFKISGMLSWLLFVNPFKTY